MKSKSFDLKRNSSEKIKPNKTFDFSKYYPSADEIKTALEPGGGSSENHVKENKSVGKKHDLPSKRKQSPKKKNKLEPLDISHIDIEGPSLDGVSTKETPLNESKLTSTPRISAKDSTPKSIMKNKSIRNSVEQLDTYQYSPNKPKKRNKSVSFMLEDTEEVVVKKTKSNDSIDQKRDTPKKHGASKDLNKLKNTKDNKKDLKGKENKRNDNVTLESEDKVKKSEKLNLDDKTNNVSNDPKPVKKKELKNDKLKKSKKKNSEEKMEEDSAKEESNNNEDQAENKNRKAKKKKHSPKQNTETESEGEPAAKSQKKDVKPEAIVENLESLSIGDNAHTLSNLLDEMTVAETDKRKKHKSKLKRAKKQLQTPSTSSGDTAEQENTEEGKEKVKWQKRKWNKDKKGDVDSDTKSSVIVDNLPLSIVCSYKKQLTDHFKKYGDVKSVGTAEMYPAEESKPVFTTTIHFYKDGAAIEALKEDNAELFGARVRVRAALPRPQTTLVARSYAALSDQSVSSAFAAAGRVRSIRHLVKGKKAIATAFVEFDGPDALQRALKLGENARIDGKKVHVSRFEARRKPKSTPAADKETDSEDSD